MADRLVFDEAAARALVATMKSVARDYDAQRGVTDLSGSAATAALDHYQVALGRVAFGVDEDLDALADFISAASARLNQVDAEVAASARKAAKR